MNKILIITTGGTFECAAENGTVDISGKQSWLDVAPDAYNESQKDKHDFEIMPLMKLLSENITAAHLNLLAKTLLTLDCTPYKGVIITCGSDTLAYIASFVSLIACRRSCPISIVAANLPFGNPDSNGYDNFKCAVHMINGNDDGVFVPYLNKKPLPYGEMLIHSAADIMQTEYGDDFYSYHGKYVPLIENEALRRMDRDFRDSYIRQTIPDIFDADHLPVISDNVMLIRPYALMDYDALKLDDKRAVLHTLYHSNTLDSAGAISLLKRLGDRPMYLLADKNKKGTYRSFTDVIDAGAIPLYDIAPACAYMKLLLACAQDEMSVREFMECSE